MLSAVRGAHGRKRYAIALGMMLACMLLACPGAFALNPALDVNQYAHTAWKVRDGFFKSSIYPIAQTPDGYLWLGSEFGLLRFDGVRTVPWQPAGDQHLPSSFIFSLLASRDGTLWIGTLNGLASWKDGKLTHYPQLTGHYIYKILEDHEGTIWTSGLTVAIGKLCAIRNGNVRCSGEGTLGRGAFNLYEDTKGNLWAGVKSGLWRWSPGPSKFYPLPGEPDGIQALGEDTDGTLLVGWKRGIQRFVDGKTEPYSLPDLALKFRARRILRDRDGGLWIGTYTDGLLHVHQGKTDQFSLSDGLSAEHVGALFEDREGNIWVTTGGSLDRFRDFAVPTFSVKQGLLKTVVGSVLADRDGSVWLSTYGGLNRWDNGKITIPRTGIAKRDGKINGQAPNSLFQDDRGRIWISTFGGIGYLQNDRFISLKAFSTGGVLSMTQGRAGNLWVANEHVALFELRADAVVQKIPWSKLGNHAHATDLAADPVRGGLWLGFHLGGVAYFSEGKVQASYSAADGLGAGRVNRLRLDPDGTLWASTEGGLSRLKDGRVATLTSKNGLPCDTVNWAMEDDDRSFWLYTACGLVRIARPDLEAWVSDPKRTIQAAVFDSSDGVRSLVDGGHFNPQVAKTRDGKLWFLPSDGVSVVDPRHLPFNKLPPPVHIEQIIADHKTYEAASDGNGELHLPPQIRDLQIDYTALSLVAPEKVLFRYKLEGWDRDWQNVGNRRQAFYNNLPHGNYRFRVTASNNSGVWNEAGTSLGFFIAPAYYQTTWFRLSSVAVFLMVLAALYQVRLRQLARQFNMRLEERVSERTRIARDLHDTLLQSFQAVLLKFHAVTYLFPDRTAEAKETLETVIEQARQAITEGRDAVQGLRSSAVSSNDLAQSLSTLAEELAADQNGRSTPHFLVHVEGTPRHLAPLLGGEVYRIACEAVRNAFLHSNAGRIEVEIRYDHRQLRLRVRDDGKGIDPKFLDGGGPAGHYGLAGMQERAKLLGGKLALWSERDSGTEAELTIPASVAYAKSQAARRPMFWKRGA
jgi:signal transduction histidine kinase/ligand-binding sensor domain-containing protein